MNSHYMFVSQAVKQVEDYCNNGHLGRIIYQDHILTSDMSYIRQFTIHELYVMLDILIKYIPARVLVYGGGKSRHYLYAPIDLLVTVRENILADIYDGGLSYCDYSAAETSIILT